jgi:hypothetical protein
VSQASTVAVVALVLAVTGVVLSRLQTFEAWRTGLGPRLLTTWAFVALLAFAALSAGCAIVRRTSSGVRRDGFWALSFATGLAAFGTMLGVLAWLGWLNGTTFFLLPLAFIAAGLPDVAAELVTPRPVLAPLSRTEAVVLGFGVIALLLLAVQVIDPSNTNFDARWYHLRIAERYALAEGFVRGPEGDQLLTLPQLASWLYAWAFLAPVGSFDDKLILTLHVEFLTVLGTLALVPPMTRVLLPTLEARVTRLAWVALFTFPAIFIYDSGIMGGADHIVALWGIGAPLALWQARERQDRRSWVLVGILSTGLLAKYTSLYLLVPLVPLVVGDWLWRWWRGGATFPRAQRVGPLITAGLGLLGSAPWWLRNWLWYGNPIYPSGASLFSNRPWHEDSDAWFRFYKVATNWSPTGNFEHRVGLTLQALVNYPVELYTWGSLVGHQPVFGFTFLVSLLTVPFIAPKWRLVTVVVVLHVAIAVWFNTHQHHMRYLTVLTPLMASVVAAAAVWLWTTRHQLGRLAVTAVACAHLVAYADVPFRPTHSMNGGRSPIVSALEYIALRGSRASPVAAWTAMSKALPPRAVPVVHGVKEPLGLQRQSVADFVSLQFGLNYGRQGSASGAWRKLRELGVTHGIWAPATTQFDSIAGEALFFGVMSRSLNRRDFGGVYLAELPPTPPDDLGDGVLYLGCALYKPGLYRIAQLASPIAAPDWPWPAAEPVVAVTTADWTSQLPRATYVVIERDCGFGVPPAEFERMGDQQELPKKLLTYFVRRTGTAERF